MIKTAVIACGALAREIDQIIQTYDLEVFLVELDPLLHNTPKLIPDAVESQIAQLKDKYREIILAYADCGTYGKLDEVCQKHQLLRLRGNHCYDVYLGSQNLRMRLESEPGTYILTDFLVATFENSVSQELGLDRYPFLKDDYFKNYRRLLWLAQNPTEQLTKKAEQIASNLQLKLEIEVVGNSGLATQLLDVLGLNSKVEAH